MDERHTCGHPVVRDRLADYDWNLTTADVWYAERAQEFCPSCQRLDAIEQWQREHDAQIKTLEDKLCGQ